MATAVDQLWLIEGSAGRTIAEVKEQETLYELVRQRLTERYALQADLVTAACFGKAPAQSLWKPLAEYAGKRDGGAFAMPAYEPLLTGLRELAAAQRFFHWDLEFPEVFYDRHGRPLGKRGGFDAIVGNPPYVRQEQLGPLKPFFPQAFPETYSGTADLFVYFFQQGVKLLRRDGQMSYISSNAWLQTNYAEPLRRFIREQTILESLIDLGNNRTFEEAPDVCPSIFVIKKGLPDDEHRFTAVAFQRGEEPKLSATVLEEKAIHITQHDQPDTGWQIEDDETRSVFKKLMGRGRPLAVVVENKIFLGLKTGLNDAFIIDQATRDSIMKANPGSAQVLKPFFRGEDLRPWYQEDEGRWLIMFPTKWTEQTFGPGLDEAAAWLKLCTAHPMIAAHFEPFAAAVRARGDKGNYWWELRPCNYYYAFQGSRIYWPEIGKIPRFSWADQEDYINNKGFVIAKADAYLLGVLQSRVSWFTISKLCLHNKFRGGLWEYHTQPQFLSRLPIPDAPAAEREAIGGLAMRITAEAKARYALHQRARARILSDLGAPGKGLNQRLTAWWELDFAAFRDELRKLFKREIAVKERDDWEEWLVTQRERHAAHTAAIVAGETELNARIYQLFDLSADEIQLIEASTKYKYGEV